MKGFVSFVGAGPGDPELLTLKAVSRLNRADVILYDDLSAGPILAHARPGAERVAVGKRAGRPSPLQAHVSQLLVDFAKDGARVVRLKSGDPGLFGRLEEELLVLGRARIPFEIIPGISAASAAAAAAGIPLTRRRLARRVQFITGHDETGRLPGNLNMAALADPEATTAVFMPKRTFAALAARLLSAGLAPETPALLAEALGQPEARCLRTTLGSLVAALESAPSGSPALILYGPLADEPMREDDHD